MTYFIDQDTTISRPTENYSNPKTCFFHVIFKVIIEKIIA